MLVAGVKRRAQLPVPRLFDSLLAEIKRFSADNGFADDVCIVGIEYAGPDAADSGATGRGRAEAQPEPTQ